MAKKSLKAIVVESLENMKGNEIVTLDVRKLSDVTDTLVIASGTSSRHVRSLAEGAVAAAKEHGFRSIGVEGADHSEWVLADFGDVVLHVMLPVTREFYDLEKLWSTPSSARTTVQSDEVISQRAAAEKLKSKTKPAAKSSTTKRAVAKTARSAKPAAGAGRKPASTRRSPKS